MAAARADAAAKFPSCIAFETKRNQDTQQDETASPFPELKEYLIGQHKATSCTDHSAMNSTCKLGCESYARSYHYQEMLARKFFVRLGVRRDLPPRLDRSSRLDKDKR